jgi:hypothetical protein
MKNTEFHKPFIGSLVLIASVTLMLLVFSRQIVHSYYKVPQKQPQYTAQQSYNDQQSALK